MKTSYEYRAQAREVLKNYWGDAAIVTLIIIVLAVAISMIPVVGPLLSLLLTPLSYAFSMTILKLVRNGEAILLKDTTQTTTNQYGKILTPAVLASILVSVLSIFTLGIAGVIFAYAWRMVPYILLDNPELTATQVLRQSREMMKGHKMELFLLDLSFIGWILLSILTLGVGMLFVQPYTLTASALFYEDLKAKTIVEENEETTGAEVAE